MSFPSEPPTSSPRPARDLSILNRTISGSRPDRSRRAARHAAVRTASETYIYARGDDSFGWDIDRVRSAPSPIGANGANSGANGAARRDSRGSGIGGGGDSVPRGSVSLPPLMASSEWRWVIKKTDPGGSYHGLFVYQTRVFEPRSRPLLAWALLATLATIYTCILTPIELAWFNDTTKWAATTFFLVSNVLITIVFCLDIVVSCNLAYVQRDRSLLVTSRLKIIKRYAKFWLWIDVCAAFPFELFAQQDSKALRMTRLLRLARAIKLMKNSTTLRQFEAEHSVRYDHFSLAMTGLGLLLLTHIMACGLFVVVNFGDDLDEFLSVNDTKIAIDSWVEQWLYGVYWAAMTVSTIGYGDVLLTSNAQRAYAVVMMLIGSSSWAYGVAIIISVVVNLDRDERDRRDLLTDVNGLSHSLGLPHGERNRIRAFFSKTDVGDHLVLQRYRKLLRRMSPVMAAEVIKHVMQDWLMHVPFLRTHDRNFILDLAGCLQPQSFGPWETVIRERDTANTAYFVRDGGIIAFAPGFNFANGHGVGLEILILRAQVYGYIAISSLLKYTNVWRLNKERFHALIKEYPPLRARVRWAALAVFVRRGEDPMLLMAPSSSNTSSHSSGRHGAGGTGSGLWGSRRLSSMGDSSSGRAPPETLAMSRSRSDGASSITHALHLHDRTFGSRSLPAAQPLLRPQQQLSGDGSGNSGQGHVSSACSSAGGAVAGALGGAIGVAVGSAGADDPRGVAGVIPAGAGGGGNGGDGSGEDWDTPDNVGALFPLRRRQLSMVPASPPDSSSHHSLPDARSGHAELNRASSSMNGSAALLGSPEGRSRSASDASGAAAVRGAATAAVDRAGGRLRLSRGDPFMLPPPPRPTAAAVAAADAAAAAAMVAETAAEAVTTADAAAAAAATTLEHAPVGGGNTERGTGTAEPSPSISPIGAGAAAAH